MLALRKNRLIINLRLIILNARYNRAFKTHNKKKREEIIEKIKEQVKIYKSI